MSEAAAILKRIYAGFNARDIDGVLAHVDEDVLWANGMDGGHVRGHDALRAYWTHQWRVVSPQVEPTAIATEPDGTVVVTVAQIVHSLDGQPVENASHSLRSKAVQHAFRFAAGKVTRFEIRDAAAPSDR